MKPLPLKFQSGCLHFPDFEGCEEILADIACSRNGTNNILPAWRYRDFVLALKSQGIPYQDEARDYIELPTLTFQKHFEPRIHQTQAADAWWDRGQRGVVSLPTGAGKSLLALMLIQKLRRSTLIVVPTIDLMRQWADNIESYFGVSCGRLGGGEKKIEPITVSTFDSAALSMDVHGAKFGFLVVDECHHLPAPFYRSLAEMSIAPFRLGLSATLERSDGGEQSLYEILGPLVFENTIDHMAGGVLAPYDVVRVEVELNDEERRRYEDARTFYVQFLKKHQVNFSSPNGWKDFLIKSARSQEGPKALQAYSAQKKIAQFSHQKLEIIWDILQRHVGDSIIIFTHDNEQAYKIGSFFLLAVLTHHTPSKEREKLLLDFRERKLRVLIAAKILNEGVDLPSANVAVIVAGSGAVREHVQRLGRILRSSPGKRALLYEVITKNTSEAKVNERRRQHSAYQTASQVQMH